MAETNDTEIEVNNDASESNEFSRENSLDGAS